ncbi:glycosyltransferase [Lactiplantibacillus mudanjiangensis]|uniref:Glycosyl transferase [Lactobacillus coryniformis subsp. coryniformis KCTC 3167 = DSM] n=1 Tax=Lactiplantibacillus mudanjiangensis TaxID=1296538 RepID=A0A660E4G1_9LACO|nr:glycosyltransferase [Lactiplantibacillus mudanjiangensis]VDG23463.1 glycosyl transferase [Lactobacillus coryniformis subsp. coryniformis KCTC 3167 = DSM] [Lactiplantibacillus mudanjiangensis]VDG29633.1 glycosyl transferase [Lactobacillus coryniformis subsp. coryniformis KCTC 3167 = DSM] [Lactiplantibacillus mudanjiangensis]
MAKILVVSNLEKGVGISKYVVDTYSEITNQYPEINIDILNDVERNDYKRELEKLKIKTFSIPKLTRHPFGYLFQWVFFLLKNKEKYDAIHFHYDSMVRFFPILVASMVGYKNIIVHSHNGSSSVVVNSKVRLLLHNIGKRVCNNRIDYKFAVSDKAAEWMFISSDKVKIIHNGVNTVRFGFNSDKREKVRHELGISNDNIMIGHVGRFKDQKNHIFLLQIFASIVKDLPKARLFLIGIGPLMEQMENLSKQLNIDKNVVFLGQRSDVDELVSGMDLMIFPSLYEGFPITLVEAQCSGVPILYSDQITKSIGLIKTTQSESLNNTPNQWAQHAEKILKSVDNDSRLHASELVQLAGFDLKMEASKMALFYLNLK